MKAKVFSDEGKSVGEFDLPESVFNAEVNEHLLHQVITSYLANQRQGTSKTKGRDEVSGGGKKPWKQKGTGRARAGSNTSPLWVRGGKAFGPEPRDYYSTIPQKMRRLALKSAFSTRAKDDKIIILSKLAYDAPKTQKIVSLLSAMNVNGKKNLLIIDAKENPNVYLSGRNVKCLQVTPVSELTAYDILKNDNIVFGSQELIKKVEEAVA